MRKILAAVTLATVLGILQIPANAALTLVGANASGQIITGDKVFDNFTCNIVLNGVGTPTACDQITVTAHTDLLGNLGLRFQANAGVFNPPAFGSDDIQIGYDVTAPSAIISDIHLGFNGAVTGTGNTQVTETVSRLVPTPIIVNWVQVQVTNPPVALDKLINLPSLAQKLHIDKDISLTSGSAGTATWSFVDQNFSQVVPEPASIVLLGTLLVGVSQVVRRRTNKA